jgi:hypothetical protein
VVNNCEEAVSANFEEVVPLCAAELEGVVTVANELKGSQLYPASTLGTCEPLTEAEIEGCSIETVSFTDPTMAVELASGDRKHDIHIRESVRASKRPRKTQQFILEFVADSITDDRSRIEDQLVRGGVEKDPGPGEDKKEKKVWKEKNRGAEANGKISESLKGDLAKARGEIDALKEKLKDRSDEKIVAEAKKAALAKAELDHRARLDLRTEALDVRMNPVVYTWWSVILHILFQWMYKIIEKVGPWTAAEYRVHYKFQKWCDEGSDDNRPDTMTNTEARHKPRTAILSVTTLMQGTFYDTYVHTNLYVSMEAAVQLCSPQYLATHSEPDVVLERLKYAARQMSSVSEDRSRYVTGQFGVSNAVYLAYALYCQEREKILDLDFLRTPSAIQR